MDGADHDLDPDGHRYGTGCDELHERAVNNWGLPWGCPQLFTLHYFAAPSWSLRRTIGFPGTFSLTSET